MLDEADKMLSSAGIAEQLAEIRQVLLGASKQPSSPPLFQCMLVSATMPSSVSKLASAWLGEGFASVKSGGGEKDNDDDLSLARVQNTSSSPSSSSSSLVTQVVTVCADHKKPAKLLKHLARAKEAAVSAGERHAPRVLVFANRIKTVRFVADFLRAQERKQRQAEDKKVNDKKGTKKGSSSSSSSSSASKIETLHGDRTQPERDAALASFRAGKATVLVATDVAARGLDVTGLRHVVNYDFPSNLESYEHRVGRAGRDGKEGFVASFFCRQMAPLARSVVDFLQKSGQGVDPNLVRLAESYEVAMGRSGGGGSGGSGREVEEEEGDEKERRSKAAKVAAAESKGGGGGKRKRKVREDKVDHDDEGDDDDDGNDDELLAGDASDDDDDEESAAPVLGLYEKASGVGAKKPATKTTTAAASISNSNKRQKRKAVPGRLREKLRREKEKRRGGV